MADKAVTSYGPRQTTIVCSAASAPRMAEAERLASASLCSGTGRRPCGECRNCRKISQHIHPDVIYLCRETDSKGNLKREITVDQVRSLTDEAYIAPNEAEHKAFIIEDADCMNISAQNAALKLLEEPPNGAVFILCVSSPLRLLETVRSRCAVINLNTQGALPAEETEKLASEYLTLAASGNELEMAAWCYKHEDMDGAGADAFFAAVMSLITDMLCGRRSAALAPGELMRLRALIDKCAGMRKLNAGVKLLFGLLLTETIAGA